MTCAAVSERIENEESEETHLVDQAIRVECVLAREDVELPREERLPTAPALLRRIDDDEPVPQIDRKSVV